MYKFSAIKSTILKDVMGTYSHSTKSRPFRLIISVITFPSIKLRYMLNWIQFLNYIFSLCLDEGVDRFWSFQNYVWENAEWLNSQNKSETKCRPNFIGKISACWKFQNFLFNFRMTKGVTKQICKKNDREFSLNPNFTHNAFNVLTTRLWTLSFIRMSNFYRKSATLSKPGADTLVERVILEAYFFKCRHGHQLIHINICKEYYPVSMKQ